MSAGTPCMILRGGSSKGAYFVAADLPSDAEHRDDVLRRIMGTPDERQIDGIGGAHPLTSKVAIVSPCTDGHADVDYLFLQIGVGDPTVSDRQNCGNLLAGVAPFAIERGLVVVSPEADQAQVRVRMLNTESFATATVPVHAGAPVYSGDAAISGVPGTAAELRLDFEDIAGSSTGALLPTGNVRDTIAGIDCTLIDNGMPVVVMPAQALGVSGYEAPRELESNATLRSRLEEIRLVAGHAMHLGDVSATTVPKLTMVAPPVHGGDLSTRTFIPHRCHDAIGVLGAVSVATAAMLDGTPASDVVEQGRPGVVVLEHPTGTFDATVSIRHEPSEPARDLVVEQAGILRTARKLMDGLVFPREY